MIFSIIAVLSFSFCCVTVNSDSVSCMCYGCSTDTASIRVYRCEDYSDGYYSPTSDICTLYTSSCSYVNVNCNFYCAGCNNWYRVCRGDDNDVVDDDDDDDSWGTSNDDDSTDTVTARRIYSRCFTISIVVSIIGTVYMGLSILINNFAPRTGFDIFFYSTPNHPDTRGCCAKCGIHAFVLFFVMVFVSVCCLFSTIFLLMIIFGRRSQRQAMPRLGLIWGCTITAYIFDAIWQKGNFTRKYPPDQAVATVEGVEMSTPVQTVDPYVQPTVLGDSPSQKQYTQVAASPAAVDRL